MGVVVNDSYGGVNLGACTLYNHFITRYLDGEEFRENHEDDKVIEHQELRTCHQKILRESFR